MSAWLAEQADFLMFACGAAYLHLAVSVPIRSRSAVTPSWQWVGWYGLLTGLGEWIPLLGMVATVPALPAVTTALRLASLLCLLQMARAPARKDIVRPVGLWVYLLAAVLALAGLLRGLDGLRVSVLAVAAVAAMAAGGRLITALRRTSGLTAAGVLIAVLLPFAAVANLTANADLSAGISAVSFPPIALNIQVIQTCLAFVMTFAVTAALRGARVTPEPEGHPREDYWAMSLPTLLAVIVCGGVVVEARGRFADQEQRADLLLRARTAAAALDPVLVRHLLDESDAAADAGIRAEVESRLREIRGVRGDVRTVRLLGRRGERVNLLAESTAPRPTSRPSRGPDWDAADPALSAAFEKRLAFVRGPLHGANGVRLGALVPMSAAEGGGVPALLGFDIDAGEWAHAVGMHRLGGYMVVFLLGALVLSLFGGMQMSAREAIPTVSAPVAHQNSVMAHLRDVVFQTDVRGRWTYLNPAWEELTGFSTNESLGHTLSDLLDPEEREVYERQCRRVLEGQETQGRMDLRCRVRNAPPRWLEWNARLMRDAGGHVTGLGGTLHDVTEQREAADALHRKDHLLQGAGRAVSALLVEERFDDGVQRGLEAIGDATHSHRVYIFQYSAPSTGPAMFVRRFLWQSEVAPVLQEKDPYELPLDGPFGRWHAEMTAGRAARSLVSQAPPGERLWLMDRQVQSVLAVPVSVGQDLWGFLGFEDLRAERVWADSDVAIIETFAASLGGAIRRQQAEQALEQSRAEARKLALVASRTDNIVIITGAGGAIEWVNDGFTRITGYTQAEAAGRRPGELLYGPDTDPATIAFMREHLRRGDGFAAEVLNYAKDKRTLWLRIDVQPIRDAFGVLTNYIAIENDITSRKHDEEKLRRSMADLERFNRLMTGRESRIVALKHEINALCGELGRPPAYPAAAARADDQALPVLGSPAEATVEKADG